MTQRNILAELNHFFHPGSLTLLRIVGRDENVDMLLVIGIGGKQFRRVITEAMSDIKKPWLWP